jgi:hypothetical protein
MAKERSSIKIEVWTEHFLGTAEKAEAFLTLIQAIDEGRWVPAKWNAFEPIRQPFPPTSLTTFVEAWTEKRGGRTSNVILFKRSRPEMLCGVDIWQGKVPWVNSVYLNLDERAFATTDGVERLIRITCSLIEWSGAFYATAHHSNQNHYRYAPTTPMNRLEQLNWLNFFGAPYLKLFGKERIAQAGFSRLIELETGILAIASDRPDSPVLTSSPDLLLELEIKLDRDVFARDDDSGEANRRPDLNLIETVVEGSMNNTLKN